MPVIRRSLRCRVARPMSGSPWNLARLPAVDRIGQLLRGLSLNAAALSRVDSKEDWHASSANSTHT